MTDVTKEMIDRFLTWQLPDTVCVDPICARRGNVNEYRTGTNLMTHAEAEQMLVHVLAGYATPKNRTCVNVTLLEAFCAEWEGEVRRIYYTEAAPLLEELRELIAKAKDGTL